MPSDPIWPSPEAIASLMEAEAGQPVPAGTLAAHIKKMPTPEAVKPGSQGEQDQVKYWLGSWRSLLWQQYQETAKVNGVPLLKLRDDYYEAAQEATNHAALHFFSGRTSDDIADELAAARSRGDREKAGELEGLLARHKETTDKLLRAKLPKYDAKAISAIEGLPDFRARFNQIVIDDVSRLKAELGKQEDDIGAIITHLMPGDSPKEKFGAFVKKLEEVLKADDRIKDFVQAVDWDKIQKEAPKFTTPQVVATKAGPYAAGSKEAQDLAADNAKWADFERTMYGAGSKKALGPNPVKVFAIDDQGNQIDRGYATEHRGKSVNQALKDIVAEIVNDVGTDESLIPGDVVGREEKFRVDAKPEEIASRAVRVVDYGAEGAEARKREKKGEPVEGDEHAKDLAGAVYRVSIPFSEGGKARTLRAFVCLVDHRKGLKPEEKAKIDPNSLTRDRLAPGEMTALDVYVYHDGKMVSENSVSGTLAFKDPQEVMADVAMRLLVGRKHEVTPDISKSEIKKRARMVAGYAVSPEKALPGHRAGIWRVDVPYSWIDFDDPQMLAFKRPVSSTKMTSPAAVKPKDRGEVPATIAVSKKAETEKPGGESGLAAAKRTETVQLYVNFGIRKKDGKLLSPLEVQDLIERDVPGKKDRPTVQRPAAGKVNAWYWQQNAGGSVREIVWEAGKEGVQANRVELPEKVLEAYKANPQKAIKQIALRVVNELGIHDGELVPDLAAGAPEDVIRIGIRHSSVGGGEKEAKVVKRPYKLSPDEELALKLGNDAAERLARRWDAGKSSGMSEEDRNQAIKILQGALDVAKKAKSSVESVKGGSFELPSDYAWVMVYMAKDPSDPASVEAARNLAKEEYAKALGEAKGEKEKSKRKAEAGEMKHFQNLAKMGDALTRLSNEKKLGKEKSPSIYGGHAGESPDTGVDIPSYALPGGGEEAPKRGVGESSAFNTASRLIVESRELVRRLKRRIRK